MGPPPFGGGNLSSTRARPRTPVASMGPPPFGGGNHLCINCTGRRVRGFNGATAFRRWKPDVLDAPFNHRHGFNGATAFRRWKHDDHPVGGRPIRVASMGPPPFGGGNLNIEDTADPIDWLQWGHRLSAVETITPVGRFTATLTASMGPPPFGGGNWAWSAVCPSERARFNGATAFRRWKPAGSGS